MRVLLSVLSDLTIGWKNVCRCVCMSLCVCMNVCMNDLFLSKDDMKLCCGGGNARVSVNKNTR